MSRGAVAVVRSLDAAQPPVDEWPELQPLIAKLDPEPYPIDALPTTVRAAVQEV